MCVLGEEGYWHEELAAPPPSTSSGVSICTRAGHEPEPHALRRGSRTIRRASIQRVTRSAPRLPGRRALRSGWAVAFRGRGRGRYGYGGIYAAWNVTARDGNGTRYLKPGSVGDHN